MIFFILQMCILALFVCMPSYLLCYSRPATLGGGGVQGHGKGQRLMGIKAVDDYIGLATCQSKIYEK